MFEFSTFFSCVIFVFFVFRCKYITMILFCVSFFNVFSQNLENDILYFCDNLKNEESFFQEKKDIQISKYLPGLSFSYSEYAGLSVSTNFNLLNILRFKEEKSRNQLELKKAKENRILQIENKCSKLLENGEKLELEFLKLKRDEVIFLLVEKIFFIDEKKYKNFQLDLETYIKKKLSYKKAYHTYMNSRESLILKYKNFYKSIKKSPQKVESFLPNQILSKNN